MRSKQALFTSLILLALSLVFEGCSLSEPEMKMQKRPYFALDSLLNTEIQYLTEQEASLKKVYAIQDAEKREVIISNTEIDWNNEFALFLSKDINKSALVGIYDIQITDQSRVYKLKEGEEAEVQTLTVFLNADQSIKRLEIESSRENYVEDSQWLLTAEFDGHLKSYSVQQDQKLAFQAKRSFHVTSFVVEL